MHQGQGRGVGRVGQVGVERQQLQRGEHALVDDCRGRQAGRVQAGLMLHPLAQAERPPVQGQPGVPTRLPIPLQCGHEQLGEPRHRGPRARPAMRGVVRDIPPAEDGKALLCRQPGDVCLCPRALGLVRRQEDQPGRVAARRGQAEPAGGAEQGVRHLGEDAGPVTGVRIAALGATMVQVPQHGERLGDGVVGLAPGQVGDKPDATSVMLILAVIETMRLGPRNSSTIAWGSGGLSPRASTAGTGEAARRAANRIVRHGTPVVRLVRIRVSRADSGQHWPCRGAAPVMRLVAL